MIICLLIKIYKTHIISIFIILTMLFDIVIPVGPNDIGFINTLIEYTQKNVIGFRNIYLVSYDDTLVVDGCITVSENIYPFSKADICAVMGPQCRQNWYLQQLLKLYAVFVIPDVLDNVLIIDSDTFFLKPTQFFDNGVGLYFYMNERHIPYFEHMNRLHPSLERVLENKSGICHHMMLQKPYLVELFELVKAYHNMDFWKAFLHCVVEYNTSGASEYEIYFNFMQKMYPDKIILRELRHRDIQRFEEIHNDIYDYVSYHWHGRY
jgi:hypothetical protein